MAEFLNKQKQLKDSLEYYKAIESNAKLSVDTLYGSDLLSIGSNFLDSFNKIRLDVGPNIRRNEKELERVTFSIDSLSKMR
jgi:hypothetical protein